MAKEQIARHQERETGFVTPALNMTPQQIDLKEEVGDSLIDDSEQVDL